MVVIVSIDGGLRKCSLHFSRLKKKKIKKKPCCTFHYEEVSSLGECKKKNKKNTKKLNAITGKMARSVVDGCRGGWAGANDDANRHTHGAG